MIVAENFTEQELDAIDAIYAKNFENLSADEVQLYARWQAALALADAEFNAMIQAMQESSQAKIASLSEIADTAKQNLRELKEAALHRLESI